MEMIAKGDIAICSLSGDYGKPRPVLIVQSDVVNLTHSSIVVCPITSHIIDASYFRILVYPSIENNLTHLSQVMIDKLSAIKTEKLQKIIGKLEKYTLQQVNDGLKI